MMTFAGRPLTERETDRLLEKEVKSAARKVKARSLGDEDIHGARKRIKKARAILRLLKSAPHRAHWRKTERHLQQAARPLSAVRYTKILTETLARLFKERTDVRLKGRGHLEAHLKNAHRTIRREVTTQANGVKRSREELRRARRCIAHWSLPDKGRKGLLNEPARLYRGGRRAFETAQAEPSVDGLHHWRKLAKYLSHQLEALHPLCPPAFKERARELHALSDDLGEDHDMAMLREHLASTRRHSPSRPNASTWCGSSSCTACTCRSAS